MQAKAHELDCFAVVKAALKGLNLLCCSGLLLLLVLTVLTDCWYMFCGWLVCHWFGNL